MSPVEATNTIPAAATVTIRFQELGRVQERGRPGTGAAADEVVMRKRMRATRFFDQIA